MQNIQCFLDIGSFKICCALVEMRDQQRPKVIGTSVKGSKGIKGGLIIHIEEAQKAIINAIHSAETMAKKHIGSVHISYGAPSIANFHLRHHLSLPHGVVRGKDLIAFLKESYEKTTHEDY